MLSLQFFLEPILSHIGAIALIFGIIKRAIARNTDLRIQILPLDATPTEQTRYGNKYQIRGSLTGPNGTTLQVVTIWMTEFLSQQTKFITLYPNKEA